MTDRSGTFTVTFTVGVPGAPPSDRDAVADRAASRSMAPSAASSAAGNSAGFDSWARSHADRSAANSASTSARVSMAASANANASRTIGSCASRAQSAHAVNFDGSLPAARAAVASRCTMRDRVATTASSKPRTLRAAEGSGSGVGSCGGSAGGFDAGSAPLPGFAAWTRLIGMMSSAPRPSGSGPSPRRSRTSSTVCHGTPASAALSASAWLFTSAMPSGVRSKRIRTSPPRFSSSVKSTYSSDASHDRMSGSAVFSRKTCASCSAVAKVLVAVSPTHAGGTPNRTAISRESKPRDSISCASSAVIIDGPPATFSPSSSSTLLKWLSTPANRASRLCLSRFAVASLSTPGCSNTSPGSAPLRNTADACSRAASAAPIVSRPCRSAEYPDTPSQPSPTQFQTSDAGIRRCCPSCAV